MEQVIKLKYLRDHKVVVMGLIEMCISWAKCHGSPIEKKKKDRSIY